uniref:Putative ovule protein n=1 Tax=Solanum chacoense TaxID=4108 RepID=A0A0V0H4C8_SOLCH
MGNCIRKESFPSPLLKAKTVNLEDELLLMEENKDCIHSSASLTKEVKIKITKKQLSELMGKADVQGLSVHQLLKQLMNVTESLELRQRSWRPALQSIPEVN